ncbi:MAG: NifB/NifX family molybdenum-iron cluster-binding protein [Candidatus Heimdallarchaeota archaeon]|nr:MAG: NifB/NifX family molybdenum-iron cluster-binding protein [Candidatus Heimdallarchaeota archaeon]
MNISIIGIPSNSGDISNPLANTFERCNFFIIVESKRPEVIRTFLNCAQTAARGAGIQTAQSLVDQHVKAVITLQIGLDAFYILQEKGIRIYIGIMGTIKENIETFNQRRLIELKMVAGSQVTSQLLVDCIY